MGWLEFILFACCTASLVVGGNVKSDSKNARHSNTHSTNERSPIFPQRDLPFSNGTSTHETVQTTPSTSAAPTLDTSTAVTSFATLKSETIVPSTVIVPSISSSHKSDPVTQYSEVWLSTSISGSGNVPTASSTMGESTTASRTVTEAQQPFAPSSISLVNPTQTSVSSLSYYVSPPTASSVRASSTVKEIPIVSDARPTTNDRISSAAWLTVDTSRTLSIQLPIVTYSDIILSQGSLSTSLNDIQQSTQSSTSSLRVSATTTQQTLYETSVSGIAFSSLVSSVQQIPPSGTPTEISSVVILPPQTSLSLSWTLTVDATVVTPITSRTLTLTLPMSSGAPATATGHFQHSVSSLNTRRASTSTTVVIGDSSLASVSASVTDVTTATRVTSQSAQSFASTRSPNLSLGQIYTSFGTSTTAFLTASTGSAVTGSLSSSIPTDGIGIEIPTANVTSSVQYSSSWIDNSALSSSATTLATNTFDDSVSQSVVLTETIIPIASYLTTRAATDLTMSAQPTESTAWFAPGNGTLSSSLAFATTSVRTTSLSSTTRIGSSFTTVETPSSVLSVSSFFTQTFVVSTTSQILDTAKSSQATEISETALRSSDTSIVRPSTASETDRTSLVNFPFFPSLSTAPSIGWTNSSTSSATERIPTSSGSFLASGVASSSRRSKSYGLHTKSTSGFLSTATSAVLSTPTSTSSFITKTKTRSFNSISYMTSTSEETHGTAIKTQSTTYTPTSSATETVAAAAPPTLTPSQTAGVAIGSTAGILLAIIAAIVVARRYHALHAAKRRSGGSSGVYPKVAYLYDPSLGENGGRGSGDEETMVFMSGGASGMPSTGSRTPPRVPQNSLDYDPRGWFNINGLNYSDPGNPFRDAEDPFMDWRSSDAIGSPSDAASALAAAVAAYGAGPQKPLPPVPVSLTPLSRDHIIPSPTLSPMVSSCSLHRSHAHSSRRSSVKSQRSLRSLRSCSTDPESESCPPVSPYHHGARKSLASITEGISDEPFPDPIEHDLLLPVDVRTETPDSVIVYAPAPVIRTPRPALPTILSQGQTSKASLLSIAAAKSLAAAQPRSTGSILFPTFKGDQYTYTPLVHNESPSPPQPDRPSSDLTITQPTYFAHPPSPTPTSTSIPRNKGWEEIKRKSNSISSRISSRISRLPTPPLHHFAPSQPNLSPPPPLKKRSLIQLRRKTPLAGAGQLMIPGSNTYSTSPTSSPLKVKTSFVFDPSNSFEGPRMSLLAKVNSMSDMRDESAIQKKKKAVGLGLGYRDSLSRRAEQISRWSPEDVGRKI